MKTTSRFDWKSSTIQTLNTPKISHKEFQKTMRQLLRLSIAFTLLLSTDAFSIPSQSTQRLSPNLFQRTTHLEAERTGNFSLFKGMKNKKGFSPKGFQLRSSKFLSKLRRSALLVCTSLLFWFGAAFMRSSASHASDITAPSAPQVKTVVTSTIDRIVDRYVKSHMFDDDVYDPVESTYKEAIVDKIQGSHPRSINEIATSVLGSDGVKAEKSASAKGVGGFLLTCVNFLQRRGMSESTAILLLAGTFVFAGPVLFATVGMMVGNQSKRQINSVMKQRYGDTYTVDATIKPDEDVELPDEDEDDDEDDDDDDDDEDDE